MMIFFLFCIQSNYLVQVFQIFQDNGLQLSIQSPQNLGEKIINCDSPLIWLVYYLYKQIIMYISSLDSTQ